MPANAITLMRKHYSRLRWYFKSPHGAGAGGMGDNIDLDLAALGMIEKSEKFGGVVCFKITQTGIAELSAENKREIERRSPHHSLAGRLAQWLQKQGRVTWENIEFVVEVETFGQIGRKSVRPDVFSVMATLNPKNIGPIVHEVKVSRADFLADVAKPEKRGAYSKIAEAVYYVAPAGMIAPEECPEECGLLVETDGGFELLKKHKRRAVELGAKQFMNMILKPGVVTPLD